MHNVDMRKVRAAAGRGKRGPEAFYSDKEVRPIVKRIERELARPCTCRMLAAALDVSVTTAAAYLRRMRDAERNS